MLRLPRRSLSYSQSGMPRSSDWRIWLIHHVGAIMGTTSRFLLPKEPDAREIGATYTTRAIQRSDVDSRPTPLVRGRFPSALGGHDDQVRAALRRRRARGEKPSRAPRSRIRVSHKTARSKERRRKYEASDG